MTFARENKIERATRRAPPSSLAISRPGDAFEREADAIAQRVVDEGDAAAQSPCSCAECGSVQRQLDDAPPEDDEESAVLQGKEASSAGLDSDAIKNARAVAEGPGAALPACVRSNYERRIGHDFGSVRVHTGEDAARAAGALRAKAYTIGTNIVFGDGRYAPESTDGRTLLAHELVHVVQQRSGRAALMRQNDDATQQRPTPEQSVVFPPWMLEQSASVSTAEVGASAQSAAGWPEAAARSEHPFQTGMSDATLRHKLHEGTPLDAQNRRNLEGRYGVSLADVRIHADPAAASLCDTFGARAFTYGKHIAFARGEHAPDTDEGAALLRHEITHVVSSIDERGGVFRAVGCAGTCPPGGALPFLATSDVAFNCYSYALNTPAMGFRQPGQSSSSADFRGLTDPDPAVRTAAAARYFTPAGVLTNITSDLGAPVSSDCSHCCASPKRKVIAVTTGPLSAVGMANWDFHWYRKDDDRTWSHKPGSTPSRRDDASAVSPICNPCTSDRNFGALNYVNVVGSWCV